MEPIKPLGYLMLLTIFFIVFGCKKDAGDQASTIQGEAGYATGKVVDSKGTGIEGARILLDNTLLYASYIDGKTSKDGTYNIKLSPGVWKASATVEKEYNGQKYTMELEPDEPSSFNEDGAVRNFTWKVNGRAPDDDYAYYGGFIQLTNSTVHHLEFNYVELIFTPQGPLIDGSEGQALTLRYGGEHWKKYYELEDIPIGRYKITAFYKTTEGDYPLTLQDWVTKDGFTPELLMDFDPNPQFTSVKNAASIEIGE